MDRQSRANELVLNALKKDVRSLRSGGYFPLGINQEIIDLQESIDRLQADLDEKVDIQAARNKEIEELEDLIKLMEK